MRLAQDCGVCNNQTNHPTGLCWRHRSKTTNTHGIEFLTRPENAHLLKMELSKIVTGDSSGADWDSDWAEKEAESASVPVTLFDLPGDEVKPIPVPEPEPTPERSIPKAALYNSRRVRVIGASENGGFEIVVGDHRTTVSRDRLTFIK